MTEREIETVNFNDPRGHQIAETVEMFHLAMLTAFGDDISPDTLSDVMTAATVFAGSLFGSAIIAGVATDQEKKRASESASRNFRSGVEVGKRRALRILQEQRGGGSA